MPSIPASLVAQIFKKCSVFFLAFSLVLLTACASDSGKASPPPLGTPVVEPEVEPEVPETPTEDRNPTSAPFFDKTVYSRVYDYENIVTLPLQFITTRSGLQLGVTVTLPADKNGKPVEGPFPILLAQTAYNISLPTTFISAGGGALLGIPDHYMVRHGYAMVAVDVAGTSVSQGGWELMGEDEQAGYADTVDWILQQPWSDGNIGTLGLSYLGISALFTAQSRPDAVKAVFAGVPLGDALRGTVGIGGLSNALFLGTWVPMTHQLGRQNIFAESNYPEHREQIASATQEHIDQIDGFYLPAIDLILNGNPLVAYDGEFWRTRSPIEHIDKVKAPTFLFGATHDIFQRDVPLIYEELIQNNVDSRLIIFDGDHITNFTQAIQGGSQVDPMLNVLLQWFDKHLKGIDTNIENIPPVTQFVKNYGNQWNGYSTTTQWPHPQVSPERWYLHEDMSLTQSLPEAGEASHTMSAPEAATLEFGKTANGKDLFFNMKPTDGSDCSISKRQWTLGIGGMGNNKCFYDNAIVEADALNFETAIMDNDYYINGPLQADIWIETTATDAVVSVRIDEVSPNDGAVLPITNGLLLASARTVDESRSRFIDGEMIQPYHYLTKDKVKTIVPGEVFKMQIEIFPTSALIRKGHKLRVSISPSNQSQGVLNYIQREKAAGGVTTIHNSPEHPSSVVLPIVPLSALN